MRALQAVVIGSTMLMMLVGFAGTTSAAEELRNPPDIYSKDGQCEAVLEAAVRVHDFPAAKNSSNVKYRLQSPVYILRHPQVAGATKEGQLVGPTIHVRKGDRLKILLRNRLDPAKLPAEITSPPEDYPHGYAVTNLHTHGLHVSPRGMADNIYVEIKPGEDHPYEYRILRNHVPGTFWYHPHKHGSVALELTGGMAGALIVDDDGDCPYGPDKYDEKIMVLQQFHGSIQSGNLLAPQADDIYDKVKDAGGSGPTAGGAAAPQGSLRFLRTLRQQKARMRAEGAKNTPADSAPLQCASSPTDPQGDSKVTEWLLVNGQAEPTITMYEGEIQRWRFIHAGLDEVINVTLVKTTTNGGTTTNERVKMKEIAVDGIPREKMVSRQHRFLYPAYRWDVLVKIPAIEKGVTYALYSDCSPGWASLSSLPTTSTKIANINLVKRLPGKSKAKSKDWPSDDAVRRYVPLEFRGGISDQEVGNRRWTLKFDFPDDKPARFPINGREYSDDIDRFVRLNTAEEWRIESGTGLKNAAGHPFHVHVNPFLHYVQQSILSLNVAAGVNRDTTMDKLGIAGNQVQFVARLRSPGSTPPRTFTSTTPIVKDAMGKTITTLGNVGDKLRDDFAKNLPGLFRLEFDQTDADEKARALAILPVQGNIEGLWIDFIPAGTDDPGTLPFTKDRKVIDRVWRDTLLAPNSGSEVVRMRFRDWTGDTVLHCHIVDHEDQGMMKNIRILGPEEPMPAKGAKVRAHADRRVPRSPASAPDFALPDGNARMHRLRDLAGRRVILVFFRGTGCLECAEQLQAFRRIHDQLAAADVSLIAVSSTPIDDLREAQRSLPAGKKLPFLLLADPKLESFKEYGCLGEDDRQPLHGTFVLDGEGKIAWRDIGGKPYTNVKRVFEEASRIAVPSGSVRAAPGPKSR